MPEIINPKDKRFVGIGKMTFDTDGLDWNIPDLHFMVDHTYADHYEATSLEFGLVSCAEDEEESIKRLAEQTQSYILAVMETGAGFEQFKEDAASEFMCEYWARYRYYEFSLAEKGQDLSHNIDNKITKAIQNMF
jgi:hypothetical protein